MIEIVGAHRMRMQLEAGEIGQPRERGCIARHHFLGDAARREAQLHHIDPGRATLRRALLIEVLAFNAVGIAHQHVGPPARAAQRPFRNSQVVAREIELRVPGLRKQHFVRVRDRDFAPGDAQDYSCVIARHILVLAVRVPET